MKTAITILGIFLGLGLLVAVGSFVFGFGSFSSNLPKGEGGIYEFNAGNFTQLKESSGLRVMDFLFSKTNRNVIYVGTAGDGIWVSEDNGESFIKAQDKIFAGKIDVYDIEEDSSGNLYSSIYSYENKRGALVFSYFPPESSAEIYFSSLPKFGVFGSSVDGRTISMISSDGGFYTSANNGKSWELRSRRGVGLLKMESFGGGKYILTSENKILATYDLGKTWKDISPTEGGKKANVKKFHLDSRTGALLALADKIYFSSDAGINWKSLNLIVSPQDLPIISVSMSPANSSIIYAASKKILYQSIDRGNSWSIFEIPISRNISSLFADSRVPNSLFIGTE